MQICVIDSQSMKTSEPSEISRELLDLIPGQNHLFYVGKILVKILRQILESTVDESKFGDGWVRPLESPIEF